MKSLIKTLVVIALLASLTVSYESGFRLSAAYGQTAGTLDISWIPPTQYEDGAALLEQDLDFYTLYCNTAEIKQIDVVVGTHSDVVDLLSLSTGNYTCEMTTTSLEGSESGRSNSINFTIGPRVPMAPAALSLQ